MNKQITFKPNALGWALIIAGIIVTTKFEKGGEND